MAKLLVIGGVAAGMSAAAEAKRADPTLDVTVLERGPFISYGACGLPYFIAKPDQQPEGLIALTPETAEKEKGLRVLTGHLALNLDPSAKTVQVRDLKTGVESAMNYDRLVLATGAVPVKPDIPGVDLDRVFFLRTLADGIRMKTFLQDRKPRTACLIAEGHIGLEVAESLLAMGIAVTILCRRSQLCWWLDAEIAEKIEQRAVRSGVKLVKDTRIERIEKAGEGLRVVTGGAVLETDFVFVSLGMKPETGLARQAGLKLGQRGAIDVDGCMRTSIQDIYAAGDCATIDHLVLGRRFYMPRGTHANRQGRIAGANAAGKNIEFKGVTGIIIFKFQDMEIGRVGLSEQEALVAKIEPVSASITSVTRAGYYGGGRSITVKLTAERSTGRFLGGQIVGGEHVAQRTNVLAAALVNGMTLARMKDLDMGYAPPLSIVWDPILTAVNVLSKKF